MSASANVVALPCSNERDLTQIAFDCAVDVIALIDHRGIILECNEAVRRILGYEVSEVVGQNVSILMPEPDRSRHDAYLRRHLATGHTSVLGKPRKLMAQTKDGTKVPISLAVSKTTRDGVPLFVGILRDYSRDAERESELRRRRDELRIQTEINRILQTSHDCRELLRRVLEQLISLPELDLQRKAGAFVIEPGGPSQPQDRRQLPVMRPDRLRLAQTVGEFTEEFLTKEAEIPIGACLCGRAAESGTVIVSHNCFHDARHERTFEAMTPHGHYIVPLRSGSEVLGVIFLYTDPDPVWDDRRLGLLETLGLEVGLAISRLHMEEELRRANEKLHRLATIDDLTGVANRRGVLERLRVEGQRATREGDPVSVVMVDVDHFKRINDAYGHAVGDEVLRALANGLAATVRPYDDVGRLGGEEFLVVLPGCHRAEAAAVGERLRRATEALTIRAEGHELTVTASFGVASFEGPSEFQPADLLRQADSALYRAKDNGRNQVVVAPS